LSVPAIALPATAPQPLSFAEESCFDRDEMFREQRSAVTFRVFSIGRLLKQKFNVEFTADYAVYYGDDEYLIAHLQEAVPGVNWFGGVVYHRWHDQSRIQVLDCDTGKLVAQIETRRYEGKKVRPESIEAGEYGANVTTIGALRSAAQAKLAAAAAEVPSE
jgi:hypothetical protein